jgi:hypothetical protein
MVKIADDFTGGSGERNTLIDGARLLDAIREWLATYISTVSDSDLDLLTLLGRPHAPSGGDLLHAASAN